MTKTTKMNKNIFVNYIIFLIFVIGLAIFLSRVFSGQLVLSQSFETGLVSVHYYGLIMALAVGVGYYLALKLAPKFGIDRKTAEDLMFWLIIGGFLGARIYHVFSEFDYYLASPGEIIKVWHGGLAIYGAVVGGFISLVILKRIFNFNSSILNFLDWLTPSLIIGQIIGRFGNLFNYEAFGYPTNLPWRMFIPEQFRPEHFQAVEFFHPWFLYESVLNLIIAGFIWALFLKKTPKIWPLGEVFFCYVLLYNAVRFVIEPLRIDSTFVGDFRLSMLVSGALTILSIFVLKAVIYDKKP